MSEEPAATLTGQIQIHNSGDNKIDWRPLIRLLLILLIGSFLLRIVYARFLFEDDGLWFTAGEQILRGKVLYREIYFDKPPLLPFVYAGLFRVFGAHLLTIRLFTIIYAVAVSAVLYVMAFRLYGKREAVISAAAFTVFSTCFVTGHAQGLNTDFLMTLPYALGAYLFIRAVDFDRERKGQTTAGYALCAGLCSGLAFQTNPKGIFDLGFFLALCSVCCLWSAGTIQKLSWTRAAALLLCACVGFAVACVPFTAYIRATGSFPAYVAYVWKWGTRYTRYYPFSTEIKDGLRISAGYFAVNNLLAVALAVVVAEVIGLSRKKGVSNSKGIDAGESVVQHLNEHARLLRGDQALLLWLAVSYAGLAIGGRFFSHYFFEILPALSAIAGRGVGLLIDWVRRSLADSSTRRRGLVAAAVVIAGFGVTLVRFHVRTVALAIDAVRGRESSYTKNWYYAARNDEERRIAAAVSKSTAGADSLVEGTGSGTRYLVPPYGAQSNNLAAQDPADYLFVWGYRPEIYFLSGLIPASRFLSTQPLTGVPADVQYENWNNRSILSEADTASARQQLVRDLTESRPKFIVDEAGMYNSALAIDSFPELTEFLAAYKRMGPTGLFMVYCRRDLTEQWQRRHRDKQSRGSRIQNQ